MANHKRYVQCHGDGCEAIYEWPYLPNDCQECGLKPFTFDYWDPAEAALNAKPMDVIEELALWLHTCGNHIDENRRLYYCFVDALILIHLGRDEDHELLVPDVQPPFYY